jgi:hypothetical protein
MSQKVFRELEEGAADQLTKECNERDFVSIKLKIRGMANMKYFKGTAATILG